MRYDLPLQRCLWNTRSPTRRVYLLYCKILCARPVVDLERLVRFPARTIKDGCGLRSAKLGDAQSTGWLPSRAFSGTQEAPKCHLQSPSKCFPQFFAHARRRRTGRYQIALLAVIITTFNHVCCGVSFTGCPMAVSFRTPSNLRPLPCSSIGYWSRLSLRRAVEANLRVHGR